MGKQQRRMKRNRGSAFLRKIEGGAAAAPSAFDPAKAQLTDIESVALDMTENTVAITVEIPVGDRVGYAIYEEEIDFDEGAPGYLEDAARNMARAALRAVREGAARQRDLPCATCTAACCGKALTQIRLTRADIERMEAAGVETEGTVRMYETETFSGHVGEFELVEEGDETQCPHLQPWGCAIYENRPLICREFSPWQCDLREEDPEKVEGKVSLGKAPK
jgi:Fe-S-cluster containining protein